MIGLGATQVLFFVEGQFVNNHYEAVGSQVGA
jgi:hypothetical protein